MRTVLLMGAAIFMTFVTTDAMISEAEAARCPNGQMYRPSRNICVSRAEFSSQLRSSGYSARSERRAARREARAERAREARAARAAETKPASKVIFCSTEQCVQRHEQRLTNVIQ